MTRQKKRCWSRVAFSDCDCGCYLRNHRNETCNWSTKKGSSQPNKEKRDKIKFVGCSSATAAQPNNLPSRLLAERKRKSLLIHVILSWTIVWDFPFTVECEQICILVEAQRNPRYLRYWLSVNQNTKSMIIGVKEEALCAFQGERGGLGVAGKPSLQGVVWLGSKTPSCSHPPVKILGACTGGYPIAPNPVRVASRNTDWRCFCVGCGCR